MLSVMGFAGFLALGLFVCRLLLSSRPVGDGGGYGGGDGGGGGMGRWEGGAPNLTH